MATKRPRITITLTEQQHEVLKRMSDATGQSMSGYVSDLVQVTLPTLSRMAGTFEQIKDFQEERRSRIASSLDQAQSALEPLLGYMLKSAGIPWSVGDEPEGATMSDERSDRAKEIANDGGDPNPTNRGVTVVSRKSRKPKQAKA